MTTKLIAALHPSPAHADHHEPAWRGLVLPLRAAGAVRVQVNEDDDAVADAKMRLRTWPEHVRTVVSVWTPQPAEALALLAPLADVWEVEERRRIEPPAAPDGQAEDWLSNLAFLRRPAAMSHEAWLSYWMDHHTQIAIDTQDTYGYVQNVVVGTLTDHPGRDADTVSGIVEELFLPDAKTDFHVFYGSGGDKDELRPRMTEMGRSVEQFGAAVDLDLVPSTRRVFTFPHDA